MTEMTSKMGNINRWKVTMLVQIFCAESLQRIAEAMKVCWAFAIALDGGNKAPLPYLDIKYFVCQIKHIITSLRFIHRACYQVNIE